MQAGGYLSGGAALLKILKLGAAQANPGILMIGGAGASLGAIPCTSTSFANAQGLAIDRGVWSTTQGDAEGLVTVDVRPDLIVRSLISGTAGENGALTTLTNTSASAGGTVVTSTDANPDGDGGRLWCVSGNNVGLSRNCTSMSAGVSATVTVPFPRAIAVGDTFHFIPWNTTGSGADGADGMEGLTTTTLFTQADATAASAAGGLVSIVDLELNGATNSYVQFICADHVYGFVTVAS